MKSEPTGLRIVTGIELISNERWEQIEKHGRTVMSDVNNNESRQLSRGAEMLLAAEHEEGIDTASYPDGWNHDLCTKMIAKSYRERLIIAGALICAELDRLIAEDPSTGQKQLYYRIESNGDLSVTCSSIEHCMEAITGDQSNLNEEERDEVNYQIIPIWLSQAEYEALPEP